MTTSSAGADGRRRPGPPWRVLGATLLILFAGFALLQTPPMVALFELVTEGMAAIAITPLRLAGFDMIRTGVELRDQLTGHAVAVTSACDGSGLIISFLGLVAWLGGRTNAWPRPLATFLLAVAAILAFNLVRVVLLFLSIGMPRLMLAEHLFAAPLLSSVLVAGLAFHARGLRPDAVVRSLRLWLVLSILAAVAWYFIADATSCLISVPLANAVLSLLPFGVSEAIVCSSDQPQLITAAVQSLRPTTFVTVPFHPSDFTLAVPLVIASLALRRGTADILQGVLMSVLLFSLAMGIGAVTIGYDAATAARATVLSSGGIVETYLPPSGYWLAILKVTQNLLVHFNLFILPIAIASARRAADRAPVLQPPKAPKRRTGRRRRR